MSKQKLSKEKYYHYLQEQIYPFHIRAILDRKEAHFSAFLVLKIGIFTFPSMMNCKGLNTAAFSWLTKGTMLMASSLLLSRLQPTKSFDALKTNTIISLAFCPFLFVNKGLCINAIIS